MSNRRRSERHRIELAVWLKDAQGGEQTRTTDVSSHGIAVIATKSRTLRQYVELELTLPPPAPRISVTALVARLIEDLDLGDGRKGRGLGLDFFLFDSKAKAEWQRFMARLRSEPQRDNAPAPPVPSAAAAPPAPPEDEDDDDGAPTFIIKPRDLGRLWAFFRGEMSKGLVRIETPIVKSVGEPVELLVVHPSSRAEWTLEGQVARAVSQGRGGRPVLEIALVGVDNDARSAFRNFVATGHGMIEEDVQIYSTDLPVPRELGRAEEEPEEGFEDEVEIGPEEVESDRLTARRGNSIVIDVDELARGAALSSEEEALFEEWLEPTEDARDHLPPSPGSAQQPRVEADIGSRLGKAPPMDSRSRPVYALGDPAEPEASVSKVYALGEDAILDSAPSEHPGAPLDDPGLSEEITEGKRMPVTGELRAPSSDAEAETERPSEDRAQEASEDGLPAPGSAESLSGRLFASFFFEAAESRVPARSLSVSSPPKLEEAPPLAPAPPPKSAPIPISRAKLEAKPTAREPAQPPPMPRVSSTGAPPPLPRAPSLPPPPPPQRAIPVAPPTSAQSPAAFALVRGAPIPEPLGVSPMVGPAVQLPEVERRDAQDRKAPQVTVEPWFEQLGNDSIFRAPSAQTPIPLTNPRRPNGASPLKRRSSVRASVEESARSAHVQVSTESTDPGLDRDIALARARVVRSPNSVTACFRLGSLLMKRGALDGWDEALSTLERVTQIEPNHPGAHHALAEALVRRGDFTGAAEHLQRARRLGYRIDPALERQISERRR